jgi:membrane protein YdbS with pleckstrin-like domain
MLLRPAVQQWPSPSADSGRPESQARVQTMMVGGYQLDEAPILSCRRHRVVIAGRVLAFLPLAAALLALFLVASLLTSRLRLLSLAIFLTLVLWGGLAGLSWSAKSLTLTNQRIILAGGMLRRYRKSIPLERIESLSTRQSIAGRLLGYATVEIAVGGQPRPDSFHHLPIRWLNDKTFVERVALMVNRHAGPPAIQTARAAPRIRSYCLPHDYVCGMNLLDRHPNTHTTYRDNPVAPGFSLGVLDRAAEFIVARLGESSH